MGRQLQRVGAAMENALSTQVQSLVLWGIERRSVSTEQRCLAGV